MNLIDRFRVLLFGDGAMEQPASPPAKRRAENDFDETLDAFDAAAGRVMLVSSEKDVVTALAAESARLTGEGMRPAEQEQLLWVAASSLWAMVAIGAIASNLAGVPLRATRKTGAGKIEDEQDSDLQQLLDEPSDGTDGCDFVEQYVTYLEAVGSTFTGIVRKGAKNLETTNGRPVGLAVLRPTRIEIVPGGEWIQSYRYRVSALEQVIPAENMVYARFFHPMNDFWGLPRMNAILESCGADHNLVRYNARVLEKHGAPTWVLETDQPVERTVRRRIEHEWAQRHGHVDKAGGVIVADRGMKAKPAGMSPKDMEFAALARNAKRRIFGAFGVPPAIGGDFDEASELANARSQRNIFYEHTLQPRARKVTGPLSRMAKREYGEEWGVRFAWEEVDIVREEDLLERKEAREDFRARLCTRNEARLRSGYEPIEGEEGDAFADPPANPFGAGDSEPKLPPKKPMDDEEEDDDEKSASPPAETKCGHDKAEASVVVSPSTGGRIDTADAEAVQKARAQSTDQMRRLARASFERRYRRGLPKMRAAVESAFADQADRVLARVRAMLGDSDDGMAQKASVSPDDLLAGIFNSRAEAEAFRKRVGPVFLAGLVDAGQAKLEDLLPEDLILTFEESNARVSAAMDEWTAQHVVGITEETERRLLDVIREEYQEGASSRQMADAIADLFREMSVGPEGAGTVEARAERIARTETATYLNTGGFEANKQIEDAGGVVMKSWLSRRDEITRAEHAQADEETRDKPIPLSQPFSNGLMYPNDPAGDAAQVANCRCALIEEVTVPPRVPDEVQEPAPVF